MEQYLQVGVIANTHGIRGEVKVFPTTDEPKRFDKLKTVILEAGDKHMELEVEGVKYFKQFVILKFKGFDNINDIEKYRKCGLLVRREDAVELQEGEYFIADLIGLTVFTEDQERLGELADVIQTGANDVYVVAMDGGKEVLIPAIKQCILSINIEKREMTVHLLEGLLE